jgi:hypothetical protein
MYVEGRCSPQHHAARPAALSGSYDAAGMHMFMSLHAEVLRNVCTCLFALRWLQQATAVDRHCLGVSAAQALHQHVCVDVSCFVGKSFQMIIVYVQLRAAQQRLN